MAIKKKIGNAPSLKIEGHSGCKLEILNNNNNNSYSVKKHSGSIPYNERLKQQMLLLRILQSQL